MLKRILFFTLFLLAHSILSAKGEVVIKYHNMPLEKVFMDLEKRFAITFSYDNSFVKKFHITLSGKYQSEKDAVVSILNGLPLKVKTIENTYIIIPISQNNLSDNYRLRGLVRDASTGEELPSASVFYDGKYFSTPENGYFDIKLSDTITKELQVSYIGYKTLRIKPEIGKLNILAMNPIYLKLDSVFVTDQKNGLFASSPADGAVNRINHAIARFLPGYGDNSVFNALKILPGVRSSGEPSFLSVWNSEEGESSLYFDNFRLYGMNNFNDQISSINPHLVKEIALYKGAAPIKFSGLNGAIADIKSIKGNQLSPDFKFALNNLTLSGFASVPVSSSTVLISSYRQTFYNLYGDKSAPTFQGNGNSHKGGVIVKPGYSFRDFNLKSSTSFKDLNKLEISLYAAQDKFGFQYGQSDYFADVNESNRQLTGSIVFTLQSYKQWKAETGVTLSSLVSEKSNIKRFKGNNLADIKTNIWISELTGFVRGEEKITQYLKVDQGVNVKLYGNSIGDTLFRKSLISPYINSNLTFKNFYLEFGLSANFYESQSYYVPRFFASLNILPELKVDFTYSKSKSLVYKRPVVYNKYFAEKQWRLSNGVNIPENEYFIFGVDYLWQGWTFNIDAYRKSMKEKYKVVKVSSQPYVYKINSIVNGIDLMVNKEAFRTVFTGAFSKQFVNDDLGDNLKREEYSPTEYKFTTLSDFKPFYVSSLFSYADGYEDQYCRLDLAAYYKLIKKRYSVSFGFSVLNVLNRKNYKVIEDLAYTSGQKDLVSIYYEPISLTPTFSIEISF